MNQMRYGIPKEAGREGPGLRPKRPWGLGITGFAYLLALLMVLSIVLSGASMTAGARHFGDPILVSLGEPVQDHYVENGTFAFTNFAQGAVRHGTGSGDRIRRGFIQWDLTAIPANATIVSASFVVNKNSAPSIATPTDMCLVTAAWNELTITFNNQPSIGACPQTFTSTTTGGTVNLTLDVSFVNSWVAGPNHGVRFNMSDELGRTPSAHTTSWEAKEFSDPHPLDTTPSPTLFVSFLPPPTLEEVAIASLLVIAAVVVALGFFILVTRRERTLEQLLIFLTFVFVFIVGIGIAVGLFFGG